MKRVFKLFLLNMVIVLLLLSTKAVTEMDQMTKTEPVCEPSGIFLAGVGLVGFAVMVRKRFVK